MQVNTAEFALLRMEVDGVNESTDHISTQRMALLQRRPVSRRNSEEHVIGFIIGHAVKTLFQFLLLDWLGFQDECFHRTLLR